MHHRPRSARPAAPAAAVDRPPLTPAQAAALAHVRRSALRHRPTALAVITRHLAGSGVYYQPEELIAAVGAHGRLTVNFHPDRLLADGRTVDAALVGRAAASAVTEPDRWADRGPLSATLQDLKMLWHVLVRFGTPRAR